jgi:hypothetical protein
LAACPYASKLLLRGILAKPCGLDQASSEKYLEGLLGALNRRMKRGETLVFGHMDWKELLAEISKRAIAKDDGDMEYSPDAKRTQWLGHTGASARAIREAESRLGVQLPEDYKSFLRTSNGFEPVRSTSVQLSAISEVKTLAEVYPDLLEAWSLPGLEEVHRGLKRSLIIGDLEGEQQLLLVPPDTSETSNTAATECWFFASWVPGEHRYSSFRAYMEQTLQDLNRD